MGILPELSEKITADTTIKTYKDSLIGKQTFKYRCNGKCHYDG